MPHGPVWLTAIGIAGDSLTFLGGAILAWDALAKVKEFDREQSLAKAIKLLGDLPLETEEGHPLKSPEDVHLAFLRESVFWAKLGIVLIAAGFLLQLATRIAEAVLKP